MNIIGERRAKERRVAHYESMADRAAIEAELDAIAKCGRLMFERIEAIRAVLELSDAGRTNDSV